MNENSADIIAPYYLTSQVSLDGKTYFVKKEDAANFGANNNRALSYYDGMLIYCAELRVFYVWNERRAGEVRNQLLINDYTYPSDIETNGIVYSGKIFNFFKLLNDVPEPITELRRYIVNSKYEGTEELGTVLKPYKNIVNAYQAYNLDLLDPELSIVPEDCVIEIEKGNGNYFFSGNIASRGLSLVLKAGAVLESNPDLDDQWFLDADSVDEYLGYSEFNFFMEPNSKLLLNKNGFKNAGNNVSDNKKINGKVIKIDGHSSAEIISNNYFDHLNVKDFLIFGMNIEDTARENDSLPLITIKNVTVKSPVYKILEVNKGIINIENVCFKIGEYDNGYFYDLIPFLIKNSAKVYFINSKFKNELGVKLFCFFKVSGNNTVLNLMNPSFNGSLNRLVEVNGSDINTEDPFVTILNSVFEQYVNLDFILSYFKNEIIEEIYKNVFINNCVFNSGKIDNLTIDLTGGNKRSCVNFIAKENNNFYQIIKHLVKFPDRITASDPINGISAGAEFINTFGDSEDTAEWFIDNVIPV